MSHAHRAKIGPYGVRVWDETRKRWRVTLTEEGQAFLAREMERWRKPILVLGGIGKTAIQTLLASGYTTEDLDTLARIGWTKAAIGYEHGTGAQLSTYATYKIRCELTHALKGLGRQKRDGAESPSSSLCGYNGEEWDAISEIADTRHADPAISLEMEDVRRVLEKLSEKQRTVITMRYGLDGEGGRRLADIAKVLRLSKERVRQIEEEALAAIRRRMGVGD